MTIAQFLFDWPDQRSFAELSGDYNPMHLDEVAARRLMFGGVVVHGIHLVLRALELIASDRNTPLTMQSINVQFRHPVEVGALVDFSVHNSGEHETSVHVCVGNSVVANVAIDWASDIGVGENVTNDIPAKEPCAVLDEDDMLEASGQVALTLPTDLMTELFPALSTLFHRRQLAALLATTRIVGMKCPGHHSIYSELNLSFNPDETASSALEFAVENFDSRFRMASLKVRAAGVDGVLKTFLRPHAQSQPTVSQLLDFVNANEFADRRPMIIGGSRGLGELCAKLFAAGGAEVQLTYCSGEADAAAVIEDIVASGRQASAHRFDVTDGGSALLEQLGAWQPTDLLYFATPPIFRPRTEDFSTSLLDEFTSVYVNSFSDVFHKLAENGVLKNVLQPSTVAIDELTRDLPEYIVAKSAAEALCRYLDRAHPKIRFLFPRLPRLPTDQTVNLFGIDGADPIPLMMDILRNTNHGDDSAL